jgi:hypothetical protein
MARANVVRRVDDFRLKLQRLTFSAARLGEPQLREQV